MKGTRTLSLAIRRAQMKHAQAKVREKRQADFPKPQLVAQTERPAREGANLPKQLRRRFAAGRGLVVLFCAVAIIAEATWLGALAWSTVEALHWVTG